MGYRECQPAVLRIPSFALIGALKWSKILAAPKGRGKNFGRVFFDVFLRPEFDPVVGFVKYQPNRALPHLMTLVVRDCMRGSIVYMIVTVPSTVPSKDDHI